MFRTAPLPCLALLLSLVVAACGPVYRDPEVAMQPVPALDLERYAGRWYEIARFPVFFQEGCVAVTADYGPRADGGVDVLNACRKGGLDGPLETATAVARRPDPAATDGRLKVRFAGVPVSGDYWVIFIDPDYRLAVVAVPSGRAGWILARSPRIGSRELGLAKAALQAAGYDLDQLTMTPQPD